MAAVRLPKGVSVGDAARTALQRQPTQPEGTTRLSPEEVRARLVKESLNVGLPNDNSAQLSIDTESQMTLPVMEILLYDKNPRRTVNDQWDAIKASIRSTRRLNSPLVVTRRPGEKKFMVGKGGNTRLAILQELFAETGHPDFQYTVVTYTPWKSESATLADHLIENELRGEMCFWDKAQAYAEMRRLIEEETGTSLSGRAFEQALKERGLPVGKTTISYFSFAVNNLDSLGQACRSLSTTSVMAIQPAFNAFERLLKHTHQAEAWPELRDQVLKSAEQSWLATGELDPAHIVDQLDQATAIKLGEAVEYIRIIRDLCQRFQNEDVTGLVAQARLQVRPPSAPSSIPGRVQSEDGAQRSTSTGPGSSGLPATHVKPSSGPSHTAHATESELLSQVQSLATLFSRQNEVADCLCLLNSWPTGFYVEVPENDEPIDLVDHHSADRYHGWWMLATLSEQLDGAWSGLMPEDSTWRQAQRQEQGRDAFALQHYMDTILGMPIDPLTLGKWLASNPSVATWMELVEALRALRATAPQRFAMEGGEP